MAVFSSEPPVEVSNATKQIRGDEERAFPEVPLMDAGSPG